MSQKLLIGASIAAGLLAVGLVQVDLRQAKGEAVQVFRATAALEPGDLIRERLETVTLPGDRLFPNILKEAPTTEMEQFVKTTPLKQPIQEGEIVLFRHLESTVDPGIRPSIPKGMKAVSIPVDEVSSVSFFVQPGDLVDVIGSVSSGGAGTDGLLMNPDLARIETKSLLQAVRVLAVGDRYRAFDDAGLRAPYSAVTLLVSAEEAAKLAFARDILGAEVTLALRGPDDVARDPAARAVGVDSLDFNRIGNL